MFSFDAVVRREITLSGTAGRAIRILTLNAAFRLDQPSAHALLKQRNEALGANALLFVLAEAEDFQTSNDITDFISETLHIDHPYFYALCCYAQHHFKTTIDGENFENLHRVLRDIYASKLRYHGPVAGRQKLYIELMQDNCWNCSRPMHTLTGLVFPDREPRSSTDLQWRYYGQLLRLKDIPKLYLTAIQTAAEALRQNNLLVTPVAYRFSQTTKTSYFAAACPFCQALRGNFYIEEKRMNYLLDLKSRRSKLQYYPIYLDVNQELIKRLGAGFEYNPHSRFMGWCRESDPY